MRIKAWLYVGAVGVACWSWQGDSARAAPTRAPLHKGLSSWQRTGGSSPCNTTVGNRLYTFNGDSQDPAIFVFSVDAKANAQPICTVRGPGLNANYGGSTVDAGGKLWVDVQPIGSGSPTLLAFPHAANGSVNPVQSISGSNTLLLATGGYPQQPGTDAAGDVWVPVLDGIGKGYLVEFSATATGNVSPIQTIGFGDDGVNEGLDDPSSIAFDHEGNLWVGGLQRTVDVFAPPFSDTSKPIASYQLTGADSTGDYIAIDAKDDIYLANRDFVSILFGGLKSKGVAKRAFYIAVRKIDVYTNGIAINGMNLFSARTVGKPFVDVLPPRPKSYAPTRHIRFEYAQLTPAVGP